MEDDQAANWPGGYCSPCRVMPFYSRNAGLGCGELRGRHWARQILLAISCDAIQLEQRGSKIWGTTWHVLSARP